MNNKYILLKISVLKGVCASYEKENTLCNLKLLLKITEE